MATNIKCITLHPPCFGTLRQWRLSVKALLVALYCFLCYTGQTRPLYAGDPTFVDFHAFGNSAFSTSATTGDMNGDGALDVIVGNHPHTALRGGENWIYFNDGSGNLLQAMPFGRDTEYTTSVAVGDLNGDGALDIVAGHAPFGAYQENGQNVIYFNNGAGQLRAGVPFGDFQSTTSVAVADLNGDGALDIIVAMARSMAWSSADKTRSTTTMVQATFPPPPRLALQAIPQRSSSPTLTAIAGRM